MKKYLTLFLLLFFFLSPHHIYAAKRIEINLTTQHLSAYNDQTLIYSFAISSGRWNPTPTGAFYPVWKIPSTRMTGGSKLKGDFYDLPNVPNVVYFGNSQIPGSLGYSLHGTYWHHNFGYPMSHGCINEPLGAAAQIYNWIDMNTPIIIYGQAMI